VSRDILIVDDDPDVLDTLRETFEFEGYHVTSARDGKEALMRLSAAARVPRVAIIDLLMPNMNGHELFRAMQNDPRLSDVVVIFCTALPGTAPHGTIVMRKPISLERLVELVGHYCADLGSLSSSH
jgi:CheY-like chemotaxis protein